MYLFHHHASTALTTAESHTFQQCTNAQHQAWIEGIQTLVDYYCPALLVIGTGVRSCTWEGRTPDGGKVAKEVLQQCLVLLIHLFNDNAAKVEYVRTLSTALLAWQKWMDKLPGCCFVEESCEALLSRMAARCRGNSTISSFEGVSDLFLTLPPPSSARKQTRNTVRNGLLQLIWVRCRRAISRGSSLHFVEWSSKGSQFQSTMPPGFAFPRPLHSMTKDEVIPAMQNSIRCLRAKAKLSDEVLEFISDNLPRAPPDQTEAESRAVRRLPRVARANTLRITALIFKIFNCYIF